MSAQTIYLAAGCFWGVQYYFDQVPGVVETEAGYTGGHSDNPTWEGMHDEDTGHAETLKIVFDPDQVPYGLLLKHFFRIHDPTLLNTDGINVGTNYRSALFYCDDTQKSVINETIAELNETTYGNKIVTEVAPLGKWWPAEDYHQKYAERTGRGMCHMPYKQLQWGS